jgi:hypothetical protein
VASCARQPTLWCLPHSTTCVSGDGVVLRTIRSGPELQLGTAERIESALIPERINDVACEVVRMTEALQRPGSSIEPISAYAARVPGREERTAILGINNASGEARTITNAGALADRVRALRTVASRVAAN